MGKGFNLADTFGGVLKNVPNSGTAQITPIDIDLLYADPKNFYRIDPDDVSRLADSISDVGVRQPLDVRPHPDLPGSYMVISGHRRRQAILQLVADGREDLRMVPCVVDTTEGTPEVWEYKLILGNAETRKLSDSELAEQAAHLTEVLYALKKQGYPFSGRMRDIVAEACQVSKSKLATLKVIRENLCDVYTLAWKGGLLSNASAHLLAQQSKEIQLAVHRKYNSTAWDMTTEDLQKVIDRCKSDALDKSIDKLDEIIREKKQPEQSLVDAGKDYVKQLQKDDARFYSQLTKAADSFFSWFHVPSGYTTRRDLIDSMRETFRHYGSAGGAADYDCDNKGVVMDSLSKHPIRRSWTDVWDMLAIIALQRCIARQDAQESLDAERAHIQRERKSLEAAPVIRWESRGSTPPEGKPILTVNMTNVGVIYRAAVWDGQHFVDPANRKKELTGLQFHMWMEIPLGNEVARPSEGPTGQMMIMGWMPGGTNPAHPCNCVTKFEVNDEHGRFATQMLCRWNGENFCFPHNGATIDMQPVKWIELPEDAEGGS